MKKFFLTLVAIMAVAVTTVNAETKTYTAYLTEFQGLEAGQTRTVNGITIAVHKGMFEGAFYDASFTLSLESGEEINEVHIGTSMPSARGDFQCGCREVYSIKIGKTISGSISLEDGGKITVITTDQAVYDPYEEWDRMFGGY